MEESAIQTPLKWPQHVAGLSAAGGAFAVGVALGWPSPLGPKFVDDNEGNFKIDENAFNFVASILTIGCAVSCLPVGFLMKKFGRKWTMIALVVPFTLGWGLVAFAQNYAMMLVGRFFLGFAGGAFCVSAPQYGSEIAEKEIRGTIGTYCVLLINGGILFVYIIGAYLSVFWASIICGIVPIAFGAIFVFMPESPHYLIIENRNDEASKSLKWLRGAHYNPQLEIDELKKEFLENESHKGSFSELLKKRGTRHALLIGFGLMFFQQMAGINVVIFYSTSIFKAAQTDIDPKIQTIIVGAVLTVANFVGSLLVDRAGRKVLLMISIIFMALMLAILGIYFTLLDSNYSGIDNLGWMPLASLCVYLMTYSIGYGPLPWLLLSEIYSKDYNVIAAPLTGAFSWILAFTVTASFGNISDGIGTGPTFFMFAGISVVGIVFTYFVVFETKAKSLDQIQKILSGEKIL